MDRIPVTELGMYALNTTVSFSWDYDHYNYEETDEGVTWRFWESVQCQGDVKPYVVWDDVLDEYISGHNTLQEAQEEAADQEDASVRLIGSDHATDGNGVCLNPACSRFEEEAGPTWGREGPVMNYYYPFDEPMDFEPVTDAAKLADLPLCIVQVDEQYGLALTGGGMDFTWEIAEAFTRLGMLPPAHMLRLPGIKQYDTEMASYVIAACKRTAEFKIEHFKNDLADLERRQEEYQR